MGAGHAYSYEHFVLINIDEEFCYYAEEDEDKSEPYFDDMLFHEFKRDVARAFEATNIKETYNGRDSYIFAKTDRLQIGIDHGGGISCLFFEPLTYEKWAGSEVTYKIQRDVDKGMRRVIKELGYNPFRVATSAWTSAPYEPPKTTKKRKEDVRWKYVFTFAPKYNSTVELFNHATKQAGKYYTTTELRSVTEGYTVKYREVLSSMVKEDNVLAANFENNNLTIEVDKKLSSAGLEGILYRLKNTTGIEYVLYAVSQVE